MLQIVCSLITRLVKRDLLKPLLFTTLLFLCLFIKAANGQSQCDNSGLIKSVEHPVDFIHMDVKIKIDPYKRLVTGQVSHIFTPLRQSIDSIPFNAVDIDIQHAYLNGKPVKFTNDGKIVSVLPDSSLTWDTIDSVRFVYKAHPTKGLYFVGWDDTTGRARKQVWSQGQGNGNRHWIPLYDHENDKMTTETTITFKDHYQVLSNGSLLSNHKNADGTRTWHYKMQHPMVSYLVMLGIGHYGIDTLKTASGIPVHLWYYPDQKDRVEPTYRHTLDMFGFMRDETGKAYPWSSYSEIPVSNFIHGAMENTTATVFGDFYFVNKREALDRDYLNVNIHEFAHHWFGDYATAGAPGEGWLHESFATYYAKLFERNIYGEDHFEWMRYKEQQAAINAARQATIPLLSTKANSARIYQKGSAILDMLSWVYGHEAFKRVIRYYLAQHRYGLVTTHDFYHAFQHVLGISPKWFFDEWVYHGGVPSYRISWKDSTDSKAGHMATVIHVHQTMVDSTDSYLFGMPVKLEVRYMNGISDSIRTWIRNRNDEIVIPKTSGQKVSYVLFDPGNHNLKVIDFPRTLPELEAQATSAIHMIDRYEAIKAMEQIGIDRKLDFLRTRYHAESFPELKAEIVRQIAVDSSSVTDQMMQRALTDPSVTVREAALSSLPKINMEFKPYVEGMLTDSSYSIVSTALVRLAQSYPKELPTYLEKTKNEDGPGHVVNILWNELNVAQGKKESLQKLVDYTSYSYDFQTRTNAAQVLQQLNYMNPEFAGSLLQGITSPNYRLAGAFRNVYQHFAQDIGYKQMMLDVYHQHNWSALEKTRLESLFNNH